MRTITIVAALAALPVAVPVTALSAPGHGGAAGVGVSGGFHGTIVTPPSFHGTVIKPPPVLGTIVNPPSFHGTVVKPPPVLGTIVNPPPVQGTVVAPSPPRGSSTQAPVDPAASLPLSG